MRLLIIRHGDPDYSIDSLTPKGWREAELLAEKIKMIQVKDFYQSPLGRAMDTAMVTLQKMNRTAKTLEWLREFRAPIMDPDSNRVKVPWDLLPERWTVSEGYYDKDRWMEEPLMQDGRVGEQAKWVTSELDILLNKHGYKREGNLYRVVRGNRDTLVFFCHFGVECVILGHLIGVSPVVLWHGLCAAPTSVTTVYTEERREGIASFRISSFGDISHLYAGGEPPAFAARFCETFNSDERHD